MVSVILMMSHTAMFNHMFFAGYRRTEFKELTAHFQFGPDYPASPLIIELKSKPLDFKLLQGLEKVCTEEAQKYLNKQQVGGDCRVLSVLCNINGPVEFISSFVREVGYQIPVHELFGFGLSIV